MKMTSRERVLAALRHEQPDRTPRDFWAETPTMKRLFAHVGHSDKDKLLDALGVDVRHLEAPAPAEREAGTPPAIDASGAAGLALTTAREACRNGSIVAVRLIAPELHRPIGIIHRQRKVFTPTAAKFVELLKEVQDRANGAEES